MPVGGWKIILSWPSPRRICIRRQFAVRQHWSDGWPRMHTSRGGNGVVRAIGIELPETEIVFSQVISSRAVENLNDPSPLILSSSGFGGIIATLARARNHRFPGFFWLQRWYWKPCPSVPKLWPVTIVAVQQIILAFCVPISASPTGVTGALSVAPELPSLPLGEAYSVRKYRRIISSVLDRACAELIMSELLICATMEYFRWPCNKTTCRFDNSTTRTCSSFVQLPISGELNNLMFPTN